MRIGPVVLKLRLAATRFGDMIGGAADFDSIQRETFGECAFVVPLAETASRNEQDTTVLQVLTEVFAVVVVLKNDTAQTDRLGIRAYDALDEARSQIFKGILGWEMDGYKTPVIYEGGRLLDLNAAYLWYQFEFSAERWITQEDGVEESVTTWFNSIYAEYVLVPDSAIPHKGPIPIGTPPADGAETIDLTKSPYGGPFDGSGFGKEMDQYDEKGEEDQLKRRIKK